MKALLIALIVTILFGASIIGAVRANPSSFEALSSIKILSDGNITPANSPIGKAGNTYFLTSNIDSKSIEIQKDNIILDGAGFKLSNRVHEPFILDVGVAFSGRSNLVIKNLIIENYQNGISLQYSNKVLITNNTLTSSTIGLAYCQDCVILNNTIKESGIAIIMGASNRIDISNNNLSANHQGIDLEASPGTVSDVNIVDNSISQGSSNAIKLNSPSNVLISNNSIKNCSYAIQVISLKENITVTQNNFVSNSFNIKQFINNKVTCSFDEGTKGNYWSDYKAKYPMAKEIDRIYDTPYGLKSADYPFESYDYYPLVNPVNFTQPGSIIPSWIDSLPQSSSYLVDESHITIITVSIAILMAIVVSLLLYRRHRKQVKKV
jgi:parallel beta-helix repeat protein